MATPTSTAASTSTETCLHIKPGKHGYLPPESCDAILAYAPSFAAAILFSVLFGLTVIGHTIQAYVFRKRFCWVVIMGGLWELAAMVLRVLLTRHQNIVAYYTPSFLLMLLAPLWLNAFLYMVLGRMVYFFDDEKKLAGVSAIRLGVLFVTLDIIAFIVQAAGGVLASTDGAPSHIIQIGLNVYMGGMGLQELFILCFAGLAIVFHRRLIAKETTGWEKGNQGSMPWRWMFYVIYVALVLITIRIIFRMVEYSNGVSSTSPILRYEVYQYVLDLAPMFLAFLLLNIFHPGRVLTGPESEFPRLSRAEKKKLKQERKAEKAARKADKKAGRRTELKPLQATPGEVSDADSFDSLRDQEEAGMQPAPQRGESPPRYYRVSNSFDVLNTQYEAPR